MKLPSYHEVLTMGKEAVEKALIPVRVKKAKQQAKLEMCKLDEDIAVKEARLKEICCHQELNFPSIIELQNEIGLLKRKKKQYQEILNQMFPSDNQTESED
ncbi:hypothetical protein HBA55_29555 [Pseudomaricurvus alkylphenolicus]|uniref:hypothetical protein n=1 Tax=Pseudomaricurvus alkylphenolicus TaxID=1306991 RepID=UPI001422B765|nr:hypothetical protein [Pseudomaricurvus alkylphenolicus]NIB43785.1 hypothetical protein [Pseudomaricurvus alkylphenolicus]